MSNYSEQAQATISNLNGIQKSADYLKNARAYSDDMNTYVNYERQATAKLKVLKETPPGSNIDAIISDAATLGSNYIAHLVNASKYGTDPEVMKARNICFDNSRPAQGDLSGSFGKLTIT